MLTYPTILLSSPIHSVSKIWAVSPLELEEDNNDDEDKEEEKDKGVFLQWGNAYFLIQYSHIFSSLTNLFLKVVFCITANNVQ